MRGAGGAGAGALSLVFLLSLQVATPHDLNINDLLESNLTNSETVLNNKVASIDASEEVYISEQKLADRVQNTSQLLNVERSGYPEDDNISGDNDDRNNYRDHNQYNPLNTQTISQSEKISTFNIHNQINHPAKEFSSDIVSYHSEGVRGEYLPGHGMTKTQPNLFPQPFEQATPNVPLDVGNIKLPIFTPQSQANKPFQQTEPKDVQIVPLDIGNIKVTMLTPHDQANMLVHQAQLEDVPRVSLDVGNIQLPMFKTQNSANMPVYQAQFEHVAKIPVDEGNIKLPVFIPQSQKVITQGGHNFVSTMASQESIASPRGPIDFGNIQLPIEKQGGHNFVSTMASQESIASPRGPIDFGNIQLPIEKPRRQDASLPGYQEFANSHSNMAYDALQTETLTKILNSNLYPYNLQNIPLVDDVHTSTSKSQVPLKQGYKLSANQIDALVQAIIEDESASDMQYGASQNKALDSQDYVQIAHPYAKLHDSFRAHSYQSHFDQRPNLVHKYHNNYYSNVVASNELIHLKKYAETENAVRCSKEGEFHNLVTPSKQCLICACVYEAGDLQPVCSHCESCKRPDEPPSSEKPPAAVSASSCSPLPVGIAFEHPLNPCHICMCYIVEGNKTHISCQEDPQCVKPPATTLQPLMPDSPSPVPTPLCHKFPENVEFPHPTEQCKLCKCIRQDTAFGIQQYQMQCLSDISCEAVAGISTTKPSYPGKETFTPTLRPTTSVQTPTTTRTNSYYPTSPAPSNPYAITPDSDKRLPLTISPTPPFLPFSPQSITRPSQTTFVPTTAPVHITPAPYIPIEPIHVPIPFNDVPSSLAPFPPATIVGEPPSLPTDPREPFNQYTGEVTTSPRWPLSENSLEALPWPPKPKSPRPGPDRGPLLGPPPHESCAPYPAGESFQHPWDECQLCRCAEYRSRGHVSIEVNCYTKSSCCVEYELPDAQPQIASDISGELQILDKICEQRALEAEFIDERSCRVCACRAVGGYVLPACHALGPRSPHCAGQPEASQEVIYIEPRCRQLAPSQPFVSGCSQCVCRTVFNYVIATCSPLPNCEVLQKPNSATHSVPGMGPANSLSQADIRAIVDYLAFHKNPESYHAPEIKTGPSGHYMYPKANFEKGSPKKTDNQFIYALPSFGQPYLLSSKRAGAAGGRSAPAQLQQMQYQNTLASELDLIPYSNFKDSTRSSMVLGRSGQEEAEESVTPGEPAAPESEENAYPLASDFAPAPTDADITPAGFSLLATSSKSAAVVPPAGAAGAGGAGGVRSGRGMCQYPGDKYHHRCQACFCHADEAGLYSVCTGRPCS